MALTAFLVVWLATLAIWSVGFAFGTVAALHRKAGVSFLWALFGRTTPESFDESGVRARRRAIICLGIGWSLVPLTFAMAAIAHSRGELPKH